MRHSRGPAHPYLFAGSPRLGVGKGTYNDESEKYPVDGWHCRMDDAIDENVGEIEVKP